MKKQFIILLLALFSITVFATTFYVDINGSQTYTNIQDAINDVPSNDWTEIYIYPGVYHENLIVNTNQHLLLSSTNEFSASVRDATIIDGSATGSVLRIYGIYNWQTGGTTCTVAGLTITNGVAEAGGGIFGGDRWSSAINAINIRRCLITDCHATSNHYTQGGGAVFWTKGYVISNVFRDNSSVYHGGALFGCDNTVSYNLIINNSAERYGGAATSIDGDMFHNIIVGNTARGGGGISYCNGDFAYNIVSGNYARLYSGGGCLNVSRSKSLYNNIICNNVAARDGGGIDFSSGYSSIDIMNNLICNNIASNYGGGLHDINASFLLNNTIAGNFALNGGGGVFSSDNSVFVNTIIVSNICQNSNSNIFINGNSQFYYSCVDENVEKHSSCISADPLFINCPSDFHLSPASPCLNAGISNMHYSMLPWSDLDGKLREQNGIDIGCYEQGILRDGDGDLLEDASEAALLANSNKWDTNGDGYSDGSHITHNISVTNELTNVTFRVNFGESVQAKLAQTVPGDTVIVGSGEFKELLIPYYGIYFAGTTNASGELTTVLNGNADKPVLIYSHKGIALSWDTENELAFLVISNGESYVGGGLNYNYRRSDFNVSNCRFVNNKANFGGAIGRPTDSYSGFSEISDCEFIGNTAEEDGGAVYNLQPRNGFNHSVFSQNTASNGGALAFNYNKVDRCIFYTNTAYGIGGAIYNHYGNVLNNLMINNVAGYGGALAEFYNSYLYVENNTICRNTSLQSGGAIYETSKNYKFYNNILWGNNAPTNPQVDAIVFTNYHYNTIQDWTWLQNNNKSNYPNFADWFGEDYHLDISSYCINSGTNYPSSDIFGWNDLDGNYRVIEIYVDRGCYEHYDASSDINFNNETNKLIVVINPPGNGKIIKKIVITKYPCGNRIRKSTISYPSPGGMDYPVRRVVTTGDSSTLWTYDNGFNYEHYIQSPAGVWSYLHNELAPYNYYVTDLYPRDGRERNYGAVYNEPYTDDRGVEFWSENSCPVTATIGADVSSLDYGLGLPDDYSVISGEDSGGTPTSWLVQPDPANPFGGAVITETLSGYYGGEDFVPGYVDMNNDGDYDHDSLWHIDDTSGNAELYDIDDSSVLTMTTPLPGGGDYIIGSYPDGIAVAEKNTKTYYTYVYDPTIPTSGKWCTDEFEYVIEKFGYTTTKKIIPEPFTALFIYILGAFALFKIMKL